MANKGASSGSKTPGEVVAEIDRLLAPLSADERTRALAAVSALHGAAPPRAPAGAAPATPVPAGAPNAAAGAWMKKNGLDQAIVAEVFHFDDGAVEVIGRVPAGTAKEQTINVYLLAGARALLGSGAAKFAEAAAVALCKQQGCHNSGNHAAYLKTAGKALAGSKAKGWTLTTPGLQRAAELVKKMAGAAD